MRAKPIRAVQRKRVENARERDVTAEEANRLVEAFRTSRNGQLAAVVQLLLLTGTRVSELLSSRWASVDLERRTCTCRPRRRGGRATYP